MDSNYTQDQVASFMEWSLSKVIRIESGAVGVSANDLKALLALYGISDRTRANELLDLARTARQSSWWSRYRADISPQYLQYIEYEEAAYFLRIYEPLLIPGLFQTNECMEAVIRRGAEPETTESDIRTRIEIRQRRQNLLKRDFPPMINCVLDESAIKRMVGQRSVAQGQLNWLIELAGRPNITLELIPFSAGYHRGMLESFIILEFSDPEDSDVLFSESSRETIISHDESGEITNYREVFEELKSVALSSADTLDYLGGLLENL